MLFGGKFPSARRTREENLRATIGECNRRPNLKHRRPKRPKRKHLISAVLQKAGTTLPCEADVETVHTTVGRQCTPRKAEKDGTFLARGDGGQDRLPSPCSGHHFLHFPLSLAFGARGLGRLEAVSLSTSQTAGPVKCSKPDFIFVFFAVAPTTYRVPL